MVLVCVGPGGAFRENKGKPKVLLVPLCRDHQGVEVGGYRVSPSGARRDRGPPPGSGPASEAAVENLASLGLPSTQLPSPGAPAASTEAAAGHPSYLDLKSD